MRIRSSFLSRLRDARFSKVVALLVVGALLLPVYPSVSAAEGPYSGSAVKAPGLDVAPGMALSRSLRDAEGLLSSAGRGLSRGEEISAERRELKALRKAIETLDVEVRGEFHNTGAWLRERRVPASIIARHEDTFARYRDEIQGLVDDLVLLENEDMDDDIAATLERALERLSRHKHEADPQPFDPAELPHQAQNPRADNLPRTRREDFLEAGLLDNPGVQVAALESFRFDSLPGAEDPAYLDETVEVTFGEDLRAKAAELDHDPVAIYHWVRNQVEWLPTWGAVQDAGLTLSARRGNAMDIASLMIALLRASKIPARYVHGTIDIPEDSFRNWAGGFQHIEEAIDYAASGGIPITGLITGGRVSHVRMEHVWVEVAVDFLPSRGAVMREADTWLPLDASYKQYEFVPGLDIPAITRISGGVLLQDLLNNADFDLAQGWVQGVDQSIPHHLQQEAEQRLSAHLVKLDSEVLRDLIGGSEVVVRDSPVLPSGLPHQRALAAVRYASLPAALQPTISFGLGRDSLGQPMHSLSFPWAELNNAKITLSFRPATDEDTAALEALVPEQGFSDASQLPSSIPAYVINVTPELRVQGRLALTGSPMSLGEELAFSFAVQDPVHGAKHYLNRVVAGSHLAIAVIGGSVSPAAIRDTEMRLSEVAKSITQDDPLLLVEATKEGLIGDVFHGGMLSYFGEYQVLAEVAAQVRHSHFLLTSSAGTYGYVPNVRRFFDIPHSLSPGGVLMDLDRLAHVTSTDNRVEDAETELNFQLGALASGLEHTVPEQMFVPTGAPGVGISAVRALEMAFTNGQRVYHVTQNNQADTLPHIRQNARTMSEIRSALAIGREIIIHTDPIRVPGWSGSGYVIFDRQSGSTAWRINGNANGGFLAGAEIGTTIFASLLSYKAMLASVWGANSFAKALTSTTNYLTAVNTLIGIADISANCQGPAVRWALVSYTAISLVFIGTTGLVALATGPVGGFAAGALFGIATGYLRTSLTESAFCA